MTADEAIIRKLAADGDGTGDDKRFQMTFKSLLRIINSKEPRNSDAINRFVKTIDLAVLSMKKQTMMYLTNEKQEQTYVKLRERIEMEIKNAQECIVDAKNELLQAKHVRKNRQEYDLMAKMIEELPSRNETNDKLLRVKQNLKELGERQKQLEAKLTERRNSLYAFGLILSNFNEQLKEDTVPDKELMAIDEDEDEEEIDDY